MVQLLQVYDFFHISKYGTKLTIIIATIKYTDEGRIFQFDRINLHSQSPVTMFLW